MDADRQSNGATYETVIEREHHTSLQGEIQGERYTGVIRRSQNSKSRWILTMRYGKSGEAVLSRYVPPRWRSLMGEAYYSSHPPGSDGKADTGTPEMKPEVGAEVEPDISAVRNARLVFLDRQARSRVWFEGRIAGQWYEAYIERQAIPRHKNGDIQEDDIQEDDIQDGDGQWGLAMAQAIARGAVIVKGAIAPHLPRRQLPLMDSPESFPNSVPIFAFSLAPVVRHLFVCLGSLGPSYHEEAARYEELIALDETSIAHSLEKFDYQIQRWAIRDLGRAHFLSLSQVGRDRLKQIHQNGPRPPRKRTDIEEARNARLVVYGGAGSHIKFEGRIRDTWYPAKIGSFARWKFLIQGVVHISEAISYHLSPRPLIGCGIRSGLSSAPVVHYLYIYLLNHEKSAPTMTIARPYQILKIMSTQSP